MKFLNLFFENPYFYKTLQNKTFPSKWRGRQKNFSNESQLFVYFALFYFFCFFWRACTLGNGNVGQTEVFYWLTSWSTPVDAVDVLFTDVFITPLKNEIQTESWMKDMLGIQKVDCYCIRVVKTRKNFNLKECQKTWVKTSIIQYIDRVPFQFNSIQFKNVFILIILKSCNFYNE